MLLAVFAGLGLGLSLIIAIGAQNLFVLRQGFRREHILAVAVVCTLSDAVLIAVGVSGVGLALQAVPWLVEVVRWAGAAFLALYALLALRRAWRPSGQVLGGAEGRTPAAAGTDAATGPGPDLVATRRSRNADAGRADESAQMRAVPITTTSMPQPATVPAAASPVAPPASASSRLGVVMATCLALTWLNPHVYLDTVFLLGAIAASHGDLRWWFALGAASASALWFFTLAYGARSLGRWLSTPRAWRIVDAVIGMIMLGLAANLVLHA